LGDRAGRSILVLTPDEAELRQEAAVQLLEGRIYDYELRDAPADLELLASEVVQPNLARPRLGRLETGLHTGMVALVLAIADDELGRSILEVRTSKIDYRLS